MEEKENAKEFENVMKFLEECYTGAHMNDDIYMQVRLSRAIAGFISNPTVDADKVFTQEFIEVYESIPRKDDEDNDN